MIFCVSSQNKKEKPMRATMVDVAELAGVSSKTVSRVINKNQYVCSIKTKKVWQAVKALNYHPSAIARQLCGAPSSIGFVYDNPNSHYIIELQNGILAACLADGLELFIRPCQATSETICDDIVAMVRRSQMAGLVLTPPLSEMPALLTRLDKENICYVKIISGNSYDDDRTVCIDDFKAAAELTQYLIDLGHKDIAFLQGDKSHGSAQQRFSGYLAKLNENKICPNEDFILEGLFSFESGVEGAFELLTREKKPTAIFACNDEIAAGCLFTASFMSIAVPKKLSIVGFEDSPFSRQALPQLTTAIQSNEDIATTATQLLISIIRKNCVPQSQVFTPQLILRDSTCPNE